VWMKLVQVYIAGFCEHGDEHLCIMTAWTLWQDESLFLGRFCYTDQLVRLCDICNFYPYFTIIYSSLIIEIMLLVLLHWDMQ